MQYLSIINLITAYFQPLGTTELDDRQAAIANDIADNPTSSVASNGRLSIVSLAVSRDPSTLARQPSIGNVLAKRLSDLESDVDRMRRKSGFRKSIANLDTLSASLTAIKQVNNPLVESQFAIFKDPMFWLFGLASFLVGTVNVTPFFFLPKLVIVHVGVSDDMCSLLLFACGLTNTIGRLALIYVCNFSPKTQQIAELTS